MTLFLPYLEHNFMRKLFQGKVEKGLTSSSNQVKQRGLTLLRLNQENDLKQSFGLKKKSLK